MLCSRFLSIAGALTLAAAQADDRSLALGIINQARQGQGIPPLTWSSELETYASYWATQMATGAVGFQHASGQYRPQQGETLFERQSYRCETEYDYPLQHAANGWLAEGAQWNGQPVNTGNEPWLHWCKSAPDIPLPYLADLRTAQCMWTQTTQIGCARAFDTSTPYKIFSVCRFYPEGNIVGLSPY